MAGKSNFLAAGIIGLIFNGIAIAGLAQKNASPIYTLYVALHTADPTAGGYQNSNEISYTGYARVAIPRDGSGWTISGNSVAPFDLIAFPQSGGGVGGTATYWSIGVASSGAGTLLYTGPLSPTIVVSTSVTPEITQASTVTEA